MDSFEWNKIFMSVLGIVFMVMSLNFLSEAIFHSEIPEQPGYAIEVAEGTSEEAEEDTGPAYEPINALLASADISAGEKTFKKCAACHSNEAGGANKVGPGLYDVVGRAIASVSGFSYSAALKAYGEGKTWDYEELNGFLWKPKTFVKGTSMGFGGIKKAEDRAEIIAYLRSLSDNPMPLPEESADASNAQGTQSVSAN